MLNSTSQIVGWAAEPNGRGTITLLWSCFATFLLCSWSAIHPNLPAREDTPAKVFWRHGGYVVLSLFWPEYLAVMAISELQMVRSLKARTPGWTMKQTFFLAMGGFEIHHEEYKLRIEPSFLVEFCEENMMPWPKLTDSEVEDRSKADVLFKAIACFQVLWFVAQAIGRAVAGLPTTTLELFTLANIYCAAIMYICWWNKPFDVRTPIVLPATDPILRLIESSSSASSELTGVTNMGSIPFIADINEVKSIFGYISGVLVFAGLNIIAWRFHFPSEAERWLWRVSSITCAVLPITVYVFVHRLYEYSRFYVYHGILFLYCVSRLYMLVEMFVGLRAVPAGVYETTPWSQYFPSFG